MILDTTPSLFQPGESQTIFSFCANGEQYIFVLDDEGFAQAFREIGMMAGDPEYSLTWFDARKHVKELRDFQRILEGGHDG